MTAFNSRDFQPVLTRFCLFPNMFWVEGCIWKDTQALDVRCCLHHLCCDWQMVWPCLIERIIWIHSGGKQGLGCSGTAVCFRKNVLQNLLLTAWSCVPSYLAHRHKPAPNGSPLACLQSLICNVSSRGCLYDLNILLITCIYSYPHSNTNLFNPVKKKKTVCTFSAGDPIRSLVVVNPDPVLSFCVKVGAEYMDGNVSVWVTFLPIHFTAVVDHVLGRASAAGESGWITCRKGMYTAF